MGFSGGAERAIFGDLYIGSSPDDLAREIANNMWLIGLSAEESGTLTAEILRTFLERVIANRQQQLDRANADHGMILYAWYDEQARQLRFNLISDYNDRLPFGCQLHVVDTPDAIIARCLECQQHGAILVPDWCEDAAEPSSSSDEPRLSYVLNVYRQDLHSSPIPVEGS